ncbi:MAG: DAK2 domain-containing protein [Coriobacteriales bacterium]|nr:DAK2 domain-containing protein [Coriobacteriales bacterium]
MKITTTPADFIAHIAAAVKALTEHRDEVNRLNVFPVPDGDTGTNMSLTMEAVLGELLALPPTMTSADVRKAITHGSLMGARGNSGVITSQILRGLCDGAGETETFDVATVATALDRAVEVAFSAVRKPVEGTMLTVLRDVATAARAQLEADVLLKDMLPALKTAAYDSVRNTPELLPILKENGVVDAGGFGLALLIDGFVSSMTGEASVELGQTFLPSAVARVAIEQIDDWEGSEYLYCTEFLFTSETIDVSTAQDFLASMGDCELLVGAHPDFKVHVHTNEPGTVLSYMTQRGQISEVHIHNMRLQSAQRLAGIRNDERGEERAAPVSTSPASPTASFSTSFAPLAPVASAGSGKKNHGFIAVASGPGMAKILKSLGADEIVSGGQTMNPSTKDLLDAVDKVAADHVFILPNNKNIILTANAAAEASERLVKVIPTKSVPQSFSALFAADQDLSFEENDALMNEAIASVRFGEVTAAIKDAKAANGAAIRGGDIIGLMDDAIEVVGSEVHEVALELVGLLSGDEADTLTILAGEELAQPDFERLLEEIGSCYPDLEVDAHRGEQPLYPLVMAVE